MTLRTKSNARVVTTELWSMQTAGDTAKPFVWSETDKEKTDKVMFTRDNFSLPQTTIVQVFLNLSGSQLGQKFTYWAQYV